MYRFWHRDGRRNSRYALAFCAAFCALFGASQPTRGAGAPNEETLKAAFLFNFAQFTRWPPNIPSDRPVKFCLYQDSMMGEAGESLVGKMIGERATVAERFAGGELSQDCDVLYVALDYGEERVCTLARDGAARRILTVSDFDGFAACGGHITLTTINNRLRFVVNLRAVQESELTLSAQLLELAIVR